MKKLKPLVMTHNCETISCYTSRSSNCQCIAHDRNGSPSAGPYQSSWSWHNIRGWTAVSGAYRYSERYADLFSCRLPAELCIATYNMVIVFERGKTRPVLSVVRLAATTPCRLQLCTVLERSASHCIWNIPRTVISTSSLLYNLQDKIDTSVCLQIMLNNNGTWVQ